MRSGPRVFVARSAGLGAASLVLTGCLYAALPSSGGGQTTFEPPREVRPADIALPPGYRIEPVATGLTFPTGVAFDEAGRVHVVEAGYSYGEVVTTPRLVRVDADGGTTVVATGSRPPWTGVAFGQGSFYIAEGGALAGGRIVRIGRDGTLTAVAEGLPSLGDHHTNGPALGPDGWLYFGQGTATNSAVVGPDNAAFGWLKRHPAFHDVPCRDVRLAGRNFESPNPLTADPGDRATTGAFSPFGTATRPGQVVPGRVPCSGAVMRVRPEGGPIELVAWGFRNPFGLAFAPDGRLYVADNAYDVRGSRPVYGTADLLWVVQPGLWYGWPDFSGSRPLTERRFRPPHEGGTGEGAPAPGFVLAEHPERPPAPAAALGVHASANGFDFSRAAAFGHVGEAFVALFGDMAPAVGKVLAPVGFKLVRVDVRTGVIADFAANRGDTNGPASQLGGGGLERPVDARFDPTGTALYVVDFGVLTMEGSTPRPRERTGVLWRIRRDATPVAEARP
jgi:glucose/arabinose dehydrogenase